ncbi:hypothetical protein DFP72DRAFT_1071910 [Ephemerocybe angulata]|uniref:Uncharacterized protein n=1 Tax=Ephemerocybe angulata TaxID=980116 RepID=A0A8H6HSM2_9AGAR|nr:hypothetical protein DFP72DRAFT_1071910 [Tulosesus angulatus]
MVLLPRGPNLPQADPILPDSDEMEDAIIEATGHYIDTVKQYNRAILDQVDSLAAYRIVLNPAWLASLPLEDQRDASLFLSVGARYEESVRATERVGSSLRSSKEQLCRLRKTLVDTFHDPPFVLRMLRRLSAACPDISNNDLQPQVLTFEL